MHWISVVMIGLASNIDNLGIGVSFGTRSTKIPILSNLLIAVVGMAAAYISITMGHLISGYMSPRHANFFGGIIIMALGVRSIRFKASAKVESSPLVLGDYEKQISWRESISLGLALSLNCLATGFGAGVSGVSPVMTAISVGVFSLITVALGVRIGHQISKSWIGKYSSLIGGLMLIAIGLYEVFV
ncbi:manganese efflux pump MntP family protein [Paenibacillus sp. NPDC058174]|uniref:manganese efflux pump MntP n=1 Tax=Paenibacillus sp. NPDC058174 TaxID=3346366 RepID=UPI0036D83A60